MSLEVDSNNVPYIKLGKYKLAVEADEPNEELMKKALKELRESPETKEQSLKELKKLLAAEADLYVPLDNDKYLLKFLRPCKFYPESAFQMMKKHYGCIKKNATILENLVPSKNEKAFNQSLLELQEVRDENGCRIVHIEVGEKWNTNECKLIDIIRLFQIILSSYLTEPKTQINGIVVIISMRGFSFTHARQITPSLAKLIVDWIQDCTPMRLKGVHIVNQPLIFDMVFALFKPFLREKIRNRIHLHGTNYDSLKKFIPENALNVKYNGTMDLPELPGHLLYELLHKYEDQFILAGSYGYNKQKNNN